MAIKFLPSQEISATHRGSTRVHFEIDYTAASGTYKLNIKPGTFVNKVVTVVTTAFDGSPTLKIGDSADTAGYLASTDIAPATVATSTVPALKDSNGIANAFRYGKFYGGTSDSSILFTFVAGTSPTAGKLKGFVDLSYGPNDGVDGTL